MLIIAKNYCNSSNHVCGPCARGPFAFAVMQVELWDLGSRSQKLYCFHGHLVGDA